jgi:hypothetical protein
MKARKERNATRRKAAAPKRLVVDIDPALIAEAKAKSGIEDDAQVIAAALVALAAHHVPTAPDDFGPWLVSQAGTLPADFEIDF